MCFGHQLPWNVSNHSLTDDLPTFFIKDDTQPAIGLADSSPARLAQSILLLLLPITDYLLRSSLPCFKGDHLIILMTEVCRSC